MNGAKITIAVLAVTVAALAAALTVTLTSDGGESRREKKQFVLHRFDRQDAERLNEMVGRHADGKGDYLMLIPPIVDGGYWIHDVHSDGRNITWTVDNTRDGMSSQQGKTVYRCKAVSVDEQDERYVYTLEQCEGYDEQSLPILAVPKDGW
ncbi:DUF4362 domain-containing protein [Paenibacillus arenilitoris]|uniref:DUF4362 domain-containing protein n=1 Tax=Paenibacillus arenilitoris TaxID=2772299 RepID=A0A927CLG6_9BACL|nr:DUF4362 domain-containing protein [Paenibacillus arenilitoris]MBD2870268.1 DUF4362 domain-containing protein [Paenibacillus arenilitoris]